MRYLALFLTALIITGGCTSSRKISGSWTAPDLISKPYKKVLVLTLVDKKDRPVREKLEEHIVNELKKLGYNAVCSCEEYSPEAFDNMTEEEALKKLAADNVEGVFTISLLNKEKEKFQSDPAVNPPVTMDSERFWSYYTAIYDRVTLPGYYSDKDKYYWETNFFDLPQKKLLYNVQSKSFDQKKAAGNGSSYTEMIVADMLKKGVIRKDPSVPLKSF